MEIVKGKTYNDEPVAIDDKYFHSCVFNKSTLIYQGGPLPAFEKCNLNDVEFSFKGGAVNTITFMAVLYQIGYKDMIEKTFDNVRNWSPSDPNTIRGNNFEEI